MHRARGTRDESKTRRLQLELDRLSDQTASVIAVSLTLIDASRRTVALAVRLRAKVRSQRQARKRP